MKEIKEESEQKSYKSIAQQESYFKSGFVQVHTFIFTLFRHPEVVY